MTNGNDFAFNDSVTKLQSVNDNGIAAKNPPLTKREYFAAMALQGSLSGSNLTTFITSESAIDQYAKEAVSMADALIKALNEKQ